MKVLHYCTHFLRLCYSPTAQVFVQASLQIFCGLVSCSLVFFLLSSSIFKKCYCLKSKGLNLSILESSMLERDAEKRVCIFESKLHVPIFRASLAADYMKTRAPIWRDTIWNPLHWTHLIIDDASYLIFCLQFLLFCSSLAARVLFKSKIWSCQTLA